MRALFLALLLQSTVADWFTDTSVVFWGQLAKSGANHDATVVVGIKGCVDSKTKITIEGLADCPDIKIGEAILLGGAKKSEKGKVITLTSSCKDVIAHPAYADRAHMARYMDKCGKKKICPDGSDPVACKGPRVCAKNWKQACPDADKCTVEQCGGCGAGFWNKKSEATCLTVCPDKSPELTCKDNPCDYSSKSMLKCAEAATAHFCLPDKCGGCNAAWFDRYGRRVCGDESAQMCTNRQLVQFGKGKGELGFGVMGKKCAAVKGKKAPVSLFKTQGECDAACTCQENGFVDFGSGKDSLGWTVIMGKCTEVIGDKSKKLDASFFGKKALCEKACPNPPVPVKTASAPAPGNQPALQLRCPADKPFQQCQNPCFTSFPPQCAEARGKTITCVPDYCGTCTAKWLHDGREFTCPAAKPCDPNKDKNCCPSGVGKKDCSTYEAACNPSLCAGAVKCQADPCQECALSFLDANNQQIPSFMCRGRVNPDAFRKCGSDDKNCCATGFKPLQCQVDPEVIKATCDVLTCGKAQVGSCTTDGCDNCQLQVADKAGKPIDRAQCEMPIPDVCHGVTCPAMGKENCGEKPKACNGWNLKCIVDKCACIWRWYSVDLRAPPDECVDALQLCIAPDKCPKTYKCDEPDDKSVPPEIRKKLICTQEHCSCRPVLVKPPYDLRVCEANSTDCCPDNLVRLQCPQQLAAWTCSKVQCKNAVAASCVADGCEQCGMHVLDAAGKEIPHQSCSVKLDSEISEMCSKVVCPAGAQDSPCPERPACYPEDWKLECIIDPCTCRPIWIDEDVRSKLECAEQIRPVCVPQEECPEDFGCPDVDPELSAQLPPNFLDSLICIQEPCSCRPKWTTPSTLPPDYRMSCSAKKKNCCADGKGPKPCPADLVKGTCEKVQCDGGVKVAKCISDGCDNCALVLLDAAGKTIDSSKCRVALDTNSICPGTKCPARTGAPNCGPRPSSCPSDWKLRCIRDPCVCNRDIWVDEDIRLADNLSWECRNALVPQCVPKESCPKDFSCPDLPPGTPCVQETCTCRPIAGRPAPGLAAPGAGEMRPPGEMRPVNAPAPGQMNNAPGPSAPIIMPSGPGGGRPGGKGR